MREYCESLKRPASPSSCIKAFHFGNIMVKSWMMMDAVINGPTPSITMDRLEIPPPEKMLRKPKNWLEESNLARFAGSTPGTGMEASKRNMTKARTVKPILFRRIGSRKARAILSKKFCIVFV